MPQRRGPCPALQCATPGDQTVVSRRHVPCFRQQAWLRRTRGPPKRTYYSDRSLVSAVESAPIGLACDCASMKSEDSDMTSHCRFAAVAMLAATIVAMPVAVSVQSGSNGGAVGTKEWPTVGGEWGNSRHSELTQITTDNVAKLGGAWMSQKFDQAASSRAMVVEKDGLLFVTAPPSVYALNAKTGATVWRFQGAADAGRPRRRGLAGISGSRGRCRRRRHGVRRLVGRPRDRLEREDRRSRVERVNRRQPARQRDRSFRALRSTQQDSSRLA